MRSDNPTVYSTASGRHCPKCGRPLAQCACKKAAPRPAGDGIARVFRDSKGRKGKTVTLITGLALDEAALQKLAGDLKRQCGAGGAVCRHLAVMEVDLFEVARIGGLVMRPPFRAFPRFRVARADIASAEALKTPNGKSLAMRDWARQLKIAYTPSFVFFDAGGREVFRVEGYLRPFHLASSLDYVASGAYRKQPEFQRFIEARAAARREKGEKIELMK